ncbi:MAG: hypothetical protein ACFFCQ_00635 [Promethearchaeota archaeon]
MALADEEKIFDYIRENQGETAPQIASNLQIDEKEAWRAINSLIKQHKIQFVFIDGFRFYEYPLVICPYCFRKFLNESALKEHIYDHLAESISR